MGTKLSGFGFSLELGVVINDNNSWLHAGMEIRLKPFACQAH